MIPQIVKDICSTAVPNLLIPRLLGTCPEGRTHILYVCYGNSELDKLGMAYLSVSFRSIDSDCMSDSELQCIVPKQQRWRPSMKKSAPCGMHGRRVYKMHRSLRQLCLRLVAESAYNDDVIDDVQRLFITGTAGEVGAGQDSA